jgi:RNA polymerase sigma factor (TIGR02999 family)
MIERLGQIAQHVAAQRFTATRDSGTRLDRYTLRVNRATEILHRIRREDDSAAAELLPLVYDELRRLAAGYMAHERPGHTLQPTALIHEAYVKLIASDEAFESRAHFIGVAAHAMRQVLVDHARRRQADKRGGDRLRVTLDQADPSTSLSSDDVLALHEAIEILGRKQQRLARVVELRYFGGLTIRETAAVLGVSHTTVEDDWSLAKAWLARELAGSA